jgi:transposase
MSPDAALPDDVESLKSLIIAQRAVILDRDLLIDKLRMQLARLKRMQFGRSSEQLDTRIAQLELTLEELEVSDTQLTTATAITLPATAPRAERSKPVRRPLPPHLPRETLTHAAACACPDCGGALRGIGEDVTEVLEYVPARFKVIRHVRPKFACGACQRIVQADAPGRPIARGMAGPALLAHVLVSKYADHLPLYRQSGIYAREGVDLDRSTLADWVGQCSGLLAPLVNALRLHVLAGAKLHGDDTPVPVPLGRVDRRLRLQQ